MFGSIRQFIVYAWNFVFDHEVSPLRNIPDIPTRHFVLQALGLMWAVAFGLALGSYTLLAITVLGHAVLIAAAAITVATWTAAKLKPNLFTGGSGRRSDGEHE
jgi:protein-S-isoprenylcysteine O-methyltransferase Ste14